MQAVGRKQQGNPARDRVGAGNVSRETQSRGLAGLGAVGATFHVKPNFVVGAGAGKTGAFQSGSQRSPPLTKFGAAKAMFHVKPNGVKNSLGNKICPRFAWLS